jgi:Zn finger protein HypA/HybF involved in hydrogenase expression
MSKVQEQLEKIGEAQINRALRERELEPEEMLGKCNGCPDRHLVINIKTQDIKAYCPNCPKDTLSLDEYLEDEQEARELDELDDIDGFDTSTFCHEWQIGEREL